MQDICKSCPYSDTDHLDYVLQAKSNIILCVVNELIIFILIDVEFSLHACLSLCGQCVMQFLTFEF